MAGKGDIVRRLKLIRKALGINQKDFAGKLSISASTYCQIEGGQYLPSYEFIYNLVDVCKINLYYLMFGQGEMFLDPAAASSGRMEEYAVNREDVESFLWYFRESRIVQYQVLGYFRSILIREKEALAEELKDKKPSRKKTR